MPSVVYSQKEREIKLPILWKFKHKVLQIRVLTLI